MSLASVVEVVVEGASSVRACSVSKVKNRRREERLAVKVGDLVGCSAG